MWSVLRRKATWVPGCRTEGPGKSSLMELNADRTIPGAGTQVERIVAVGADTHLGSESMGSNASWMRRN